MLCHLLGLDVSWASLLPNIGSLLPVQGKSPKPHPIPTWPWTHRPPPLRGWEASLCNCAWRFPQPQFPSLRCRVMRSWWVGPRQAKEIVQKNQAHIIPQIREARCSQALYPFGTIDTSCYHPGQTCLRATPQEAWLPGGHSVGSIFRFEKHLRNSPLRNWIASKAKTCLTF